MFEIYNQNPKTGGICGLNVNLGLAYVHQYVLIFILAMKIAVFLKEGDNRMLQLDKGKITTAGEVKNMMFDVLSISKSAYNVFSIWFISPHLGK